MENTVQNGNKEEKRRIIILRATVVSVICMAAAAVFFYGGYRFGSETTAAPASVPEKTAEIEQALRYIVISENGRLCLYESDSMGQRLIVSKDISLGMFPKDDREVLLSGAEFSDLAQAQALFEDFAG